MPKVRPAAKLYAIEGKWPDGSYLARGPYETPADARAILRTLKREGALSLEIVELSPPSSMKPLKGYPKRRAQ